MEKNLKNKLQELKKMKSYEVNEYFANDFAEDYDYYEKERNNTNVLKFLNDEFIDIDLDYSRTKKFDNKVKNTLDRALSMLD